ncbi:MAG: MBL fold metallo-hydrolase [Lachnospiraceae bacterium]|jgi:phosphoribosyl 1,2-cyclic phosphodiesterase|nr:MBL fold metallo-hydrolase [Lachnospiraceae bacterium]
MRLVSLSSGSDGNSIYVGSDNTHLLVDAGVSGKKIEQGLNRIGLKGEDIDGILLTHEHVDHVQGLGVMSRRYGIPIYAPIETIAALSSVKGLGVIDNSLFRPIEVSKEITIGDITVNSTDISHDAARPVAYRFYYNGSSCGIITDLGVYDESIVGDFAGLDAYLVEANHDVNMVHAGPYTYSLKNRILGERGHLSNETSGRLISRLLKDNCKYVAIGHLSKINNYPELAYESVKLEITNAPCEYDGNDFPIFVAKRGELSCAFEF